MNVLHQSIFVLACPLSRYSFSLSKAQLEYSSTRNIPALIKSAMNTRALLAFFVVCSAVVVSDALKQWPRRERHRRRQQQQSVQRYGGKGGMMMSSGAVEIMEEDDELFDDDFVIENAFETDGPPKEGKEKELDNVDGTDDTDDLVSGANASLVPSLTNMPSQTPTQVVAEATTAAPSELTSAPSFMVPATANPTRAPSNPPSTVQVQVGTAAPSFADSLLAVQSPVPTISPVGGVNGSETDSGIFKEYYTHRLVPFAVSIEGDEVSNDLGITSCLLTEMQKNLSNLFNIEVRFALTFCLARFLQRYMVLTV